MRVLAQLQVAWVKLQHVRSIRRHGWSGVYVGDYRRAPSWAYTVGFDETLDHPEIVFFDVPQKLANALMWRIFEEVKSRALIIEDGLAWPLDEEQRFVWRKVHPTQIAQWLTLACMRRYRMSGKHYGLEAYQLVLPDPAGVLPWEDGYDERLRPLQPALYERRECDE